MKDYIIGFDGSPHADGVCSKLLKQSLGFISKAGVETHYIRLVDLALPIFHGNYVQTPPNNREDLWMKIKNAKGLIFATPVHWFNMSTSMKNLLDWLTTFEIEGFTLEGKAAAVITVCEEDGGEKAITDIVGPLMHQGLIFFPYSSVFFNKNMNNKSEKDWMNRDIKLLSENMIKMINLIKFKKPNWDYSD